MLSGMKLTDKELVDLFSEEYPGVDFSTMSPLFDGRRRLMAILPDGCWFEIVFEAVETAVEDLMKVLIEPWVSGALKPYPLAYRLATMDRS